MKRFLILAGILLLLSSCASKQEEEGLVHGVAGDALTARLTLERIGEEKGGDRIAIVLQNPAKVPVQSIRSWVRFDPAQLLVSDLHIEDGRFLLFAPGEREVEKTTGFIRLGGAARTGIPDERIVFASFRVRETSMRGKKNTPVLLSFYDWKAEGTGHTAALSLSPHGALNIIEAPSSLLLP